MDRTQTICDSKACYKDSTVSLFDLDVSVGALVLHFSVWC